MTCGRRRYRGGRPAIWRPMPPTAAQQPLNPVTARREPHSMGQALRDPPLLAAVEKTHQRLHLVYAKLGKEQNCLHISGDSKETIAQERPQLAQEGRVDGNGWLVAARHVQRKIAGAVVVQHFQAYVDESALAFEHLHGGGGGASARYCRAINSRGNHWQAITCDGGWHNHFALHARKLSLTL